MSKIQLNLSFTSSTKEQYRYKTNPLKKEKEKENEKKIYLSEKGGTVDLCLQVCIMFHTRTKLKRFILLQKINLLGLCPLFMRMLLERTYFLRQGNDILFILISATAPSTDGDTKLNGATLHQMCEAK